MNRPRLLAGLVGATAIVVASMFAASPANAAVLPAGQQINTVEVFSSQMFKVSPTDASRTTVGAGTGVQRVVGLDVDDTGQGWAIQNNVPDDGPDNCVLYQADAVAGTLTNPLTLAIGDDDNLVCGGLDLTAGVLRIVCFTDFDSGNPTVHFGTIDPATAIVTPQLSFPDDEEFTAIAVNPIDGVWWAFSLNGGANSVYIVDIAEQELETQAFDADKLPQGADFDRSGQLWISTLEPGNPSTPQLATLDLTDGSSPFVAAYNPAPTEISHNLTVWGGLPATGANANTLPLALGAVMLMLAGVAFAATSRIRRREP